MYNNVHNLKQSQINKYLKEGFDDYNNDYGEEIKNILIGIYKQPNIQITKEQSLLLVELIIDNQSINLIVENNKYKKIDYSSDAIEKMFNQRNKIKNNKIEFFSEIFKNNEMDALLKLKILIEDKELGKVLLETSNMSLTESLIEFKNNHYYYSNIEKDKNFQIQNEDNIKNLSKELLKLDNKLIELDNDKIFYQTIGWKRFITDTYELIFDKSNPNRDLFTFDFAEQRLKKAIGIDDSKSKENKTSLKIK